MTGFTPGRWQWFPSVSKERPAVIDTEIGVDSTNGTIIAEVARGKQFEANARLIAAAPELYEALTAFVAAGNMNVFSPDADRALGEALDKAEEALAKARGEA